MSATEAELTALLRSELVHLWTDLSWARRAAMPPPGAWSVGAVNIADRIRAISEAVGPISWEDVPSDGFEDYEDLHRQWGIEVTPVDWDRANALRRSVAGQ